MYIYRVRNLITKKIYIGLTVETPKERFRKHLLEVKSGSCTYFHNSIRKHGPENFKIDILHYCSSVLEMKEMEKYCIKYFDTTNRENGYNLTYGGDGTHGCLKSEETRDKIRQKALGRIVSQETKDKQSKAQRKRIWTEFDKDIVRQNALLRRKKVDQYNLNGEYIKTFSSVREASESIRLSRTTIWRCITGKCKNVRGFIFKYKE